MPATLVAREAVSSSIASGEAPPSRLHTECFRASARRLALRDLGAHLRTERWNLDSAKRDLDDFLVLWLSRSCAVLRAELRRRYRLQRCKKANTAAAVSGHQ